MNRFSSIFYAFGILLFSETCTSKKTKIIDLSEGISSFKMYEFFPKFFTPKKVFCKNKPNLSHYFLKVSMLDDFSTIGAFDIFVMNDEIKKYYKSISFLKDGFSKKAVKAQTKNYIAQKNADIELILFADVKRDEKISLDDARSTWKVFLQWDGQKIYPQKIEKVNGDIIFAEVLGHSFDKKKVAYKLLFRKPKIKNFESPKLCIRHCNFLVKTKIQI